MGEGGKEYRFHQWSQKPKKKLFSIGMREGGQIKLKTGVSSVTNQNPNQIIQ